MPARLPATVVLVTRRLLSVLTYMPPADADAVLPTTREFSTMISTRVLPKIPPADSKTTTCVSAGTGNVRSPEKKYSGQIDTKCVADSPPPSPAVLFSTVVLVTRRVLFDWAYMPPDPVVAVLPTTREFSMLIHTRNDPQIPPAHSKTTTKRQCRNRQTRHRRRFTQAPTTIPTRTIL